MLEYLWREKQTSIITIKNYAEADSPWNGEAALIYVQRGQNSLRKVFGTAKDNTYKCFLLLNDIPLIKWHSDNEYWCPTCEQLISAGYGLEMVDENTIARIRSHTNQQYESIHESIKELSPVFGLLPTGYYIIADLTLYPTNGNGDFFWNITNMPKYNQGTCATGYRGEWVGGTPRFILPTQTPIYYDSSTVELYRRQYKDGYKLRGLAYYLDGYLCALLDGHHKAVAAAMEGYDFKCITILPVQSYYPGNKQNESYIWFGGVQIPFAELPPEINKKIIKNFRQQRNLTIDETQKYLMLESVCWDNAVWPKELMEKGKKYPTVLNVACIELAGDLTNERIENLLSMRDDESLRQLDVVFKALIAIGDSRLKDISLAIANKEDYKDLWEDAFKCLSQIQSEEIEDFFINFLINDEKLRPHLTKIADDYLAGRG